jgi:hypothetical protein
VPENSGYSIFTSAARETHAAESLFAQGKAMLHADEMAAREVEML